VLNALDPVEVLRRLLDGQTIEVKASVRLANSRTGEKTSTRVRARSHRSEGSQRSEEED
jgi:hypothetical protein